MKAARLPGLLAVFLLASVASSASAQYVWLDASGRKVFSDRAPPISVPERSVLKRPGGAPQPMSPQPSGLQEAPPQPPVGAAPKPPGKDSELEARRKQAEDADAARKKAEDAKLALARADNCQRARQAAAQFDSGVRIAQMNAQGERSFMDDQTRAAESQRAQGIIASDCR